MAESRDVSSYGTKQLVENLRSTLLSYLEAQYHIRDESLLDKRKRLLSEDGVIWQEPYLESNQSYETLDGFEGLGLPSEVSSVLTQLSKMDVGVPKTPYRHQATALNEFFTEDNDLVVSTGTGSGKTESFLMPIIGQLSLECSRTETRDLPGVRALLLYPMNALVNDQMSRVRRLLGNTSANQLIRGTRERPIRFGSYTSRTPYAGKRTGTKDRINLEPLFDNYYLNPNLSDEIKEKLHALGKWPAKDLEKFFAADQITETTISRGKRKGKTNTNRNFHKRLKTQAQDRELMTRHEIHECPPELLITNYSMLEYMMLRPIEASIFDHTRQWLKSDDSNLFTLVVDEAHMYRGTGGAEVAFLIRRLCSRLGIPRRRMRVILTSASLGPPENAIATGSSFGKDLTGHDGRELAVVLGTPEGRPDRTGDYGLAFSALHAFSLAKLERFHVSPGASIAALIELAEKLNWTPISTEKETSAEMVQDWLFERLQGFSPAEDLLELIGGTAKSITEIRSELSNRSGVQVSEEALSSLVAICAFAKRARDKKVFLPTRIHLMFRGIPGVYACLNSACTEDAGSEEVKLGKITTVASTSCDCGGRIYEVLTHRDCGRAFIKGYVEGIDGDFLWSEPTTSLFQEVKRPLVPIEILVDREPHRSFGGAREIWIDTKSGKLSSDAPQDSENYLKGFSPIIPVENNIVFSQCPCCLKSWTDNKTKIMDLATKGEAPFANLTKTLLTSQPPAQPESANLPNGGRKVLLFSDGRQKAARLARDIPREVLADTFRQVLVIASQKLESIGIEPRPNLDMYIAFLSVVSEHSLSLFDGDDYQYLSQHVRQFNDNDDLEDALEDMRGISPVSQYQKHLMGQLCGRFYSLSGTTIAFLSPSDRASRKLDSVLKKSGIENTDLFHEASLAWISIFAEGYAFDAQVDDAVRNQAAGWYRPNWGRSNKLPNKLGEILGKAGLSKNEQQTFSAAFNEALLHTGTGDNSHFLNPDRVLITNGLEKKLIGCSQCLELSFFKIGDYCPNCGSDETVNIDPSNDEYVKSRKGFWRSPVISALHGDLSVRSIDAQEHSAQLSHRDTGVVYSTTEQFELRFQDICAEGERPIDILSSTTTMEVGIDIGSLIAVGLRNVPPQRENYQQRAGRAGRRGASISAVLTYAQSGPHDAFFFESPKSMVAGPTRTPEIKIDNPKIAKRHIFSHLIQSFFHGLLCELPSIDEKPNGRLESSLGFTRPFFEEEAFPDYNFATFEKVILDNVESEESSLITEIESWVPDSLLRQQEQPDCWIKNTILELVDQLGKLRPEGLSFESDITILNQDDNGEDESKIEPSSQNQVKAELLEFLFYHGMFPSYAFPTDVASFQIEEYSNQKTKIIEKPQQSMSVALSEYAPGRLAVVNKKTYKVGGITADCLPTTYDRAEATFQTARYVSHCTACNHVEEATQQDFDERENLENYCEVCSDILNTEMVLTPEVFHPENAKPISETDNEQDITYATYAQFPIPENESYDLHKCGENLSVSHESDCRLITLNKGLFSGESYSGFYVCGKCGKASTKQLSGSHRRPYYPERNFALGSFTRECDGEFHNVFLGHQFSTDLMLLRLVVTNPLKREISDAGVLSTYEDALYSISEALKLTASVHPELDLDESELGVGFRVIPFSQSEDLEFDIYLYDTLSGGAGYSEIASRYADQILQSTLSILEDCPGACDRSCQDCLRHYRNQHIQPRLDRHLGAELLRYGLTGEVERDLNVAVQEKELQALSRMLEIDGASVLGPQDFAGVRAAQVFEYKGTRVAVGVHSGILDTNELSPSYFEIQNEIDVKLVDVNRYFLKRNLPEQHLRVRTALAIQS